MDKVNINQIKKLREETGAGIAEIKQALEEAGGNEAMVKTILKNKGLDKAAKKAGRQTAAGVVEAYIHADRTRGAVVVLTCETDFVARNEEFVKLAHELTMQVCAMEAKDEKELLKQPWIRDESRTIEDLIKENITKFGENIVVKHLARFSLREEKG